MYHPALGKRTGFGYSCSCSRISQKRLLRVSGFNCAVVISSGECSNNEHSQQQPNRAENTGPCQCLPQPFLRISRMLCQLHSQRRAKLGFCLHVKGLCPENSVREGVFCFLFLQNKNIRNVSATFRGWGEPVTNAKRKLIFHTRTASSLFWSSF